GVDPVACSGEIESGSGSIPLMYASFLAIADRLFGGHIDLPLGAPCTVFRIFAAFWAVFSTR
ncbi:hypothetical protein, partial [Mesorhizobium sp.]|uniref:hypothetical protein n=1 Tax=Mesorhizobium sp. TaxID=1871066 RepID=UPI0025EA3AA9